MAVDTAGLFITVGCMWPLEVSDFLLLAVSSLGKWFVEVDS